MLRIAHGAGASEAPWTTQSDGSTG